MPHRYVAVEELGDPPLAHVLVDGAPRPGSVLVLSHWPGSPTPKALSRDTSTEIVFAYLHAGSRSTRLARSMRSTVAAGTGAQVVTNDHFDVDGLASVFALVDPDAAVRREELLVDVATCGDFGVVKSRTAARVAYSIGPIGDEAADEGAPEVARHDTAVRTAGSGIAYRAVLERAVELLDHPERFRRYWQMEEDALTASLDDLRSGAIGIKEDHGADLAVVTRYHEGTGRKSAALHRDAVHSATACSRILSFDGDRCEMWLRYESWVRFVSRKVPLRPDLAPLGAELGALEPSGQSWQADGVAATTVSLRPPGDGRTGIAPGLVEKTVAAYLCRTPGAFDPWRSGPSLAAVPGRSVDR